ncbi:hypothetical protein SARC_05632 [Sphaeroforma arctica JP610]|uniref:Uncharacterized protein n=1 Tax=Sphaeroforma arctica JP610 TaxID=667725 RepID=A0A0L0FZV1_9EUKA|nr:hypothetical protein SARC_05632 [Sphaeroforma arctica JP610]KNC82081.1 hypothetical protein SARC_05632 [Sphaeroforma arctica JP610]|eukprot:XP_014155983.1 hypothetical protein SARC_05632 [Sphaeroforma arctica JP610]
MRDMTMCTNLMPPMAGTAKLANRQPVKQKENTSLSWVPCVGALLQVALSSVSMLCTGDGGSRESAWNTSGSKTEIAAIEVCQPKIVTEDLSSSSDSLSSLKLSRRVSFPTKQIEFVDTTFSKCEYDRSSLILSPLTASKHRQIMNELYIYRKYEMDVFRTTSSA